MPRLVDLAQTALEVENARDAIQARGLDMSALSWRDRVSGELVSMPQPEHDIDSVGVTLQAGAAVAVVVLYRGGFAEVTVATGGEPEVQTPDVEHPHEFLAVIEDAAESVAGAADTGSVGVLGQVRGQVTQTLGGLAGQFFEAAHQAAQRGLRR